MEQVYGELIAIRVVATRTMVYLAKTQSDPKGWLEKELTATLADIDSWNIEGEADPDKIKDAARSAANNIFGGISL